MVVAGWQSDDSPDAKMTQESANAASPQILSSTWRGKQSARPGNSPAWALRWTHGECVDDIERMLQKRLFTTGGAIDQEAQWQLFLEFARNQQLQSSFGELDVNSIREHAVSMRDYVASHTQGAPLSTLLSESGASCLA